MTFLNPAILWALAAVSIPIIIHIFNLKKTKKIEFSTLMFLKEIQQSKYKKIKLKQLFILLCRMAFIILLALMFAKPFYKGYLGSPSDKASSSVLIILDDSFSMQSRETSGNTFELAKNKVSSLLDVLGENDEVFFTTVSAINRLDRNILYKDKGKIKDTLGSIKTGDASKSLNEVLYFAGEILKSASHNYKEVYLITDGQKTFIETPAVITEGFKTNEQTKLNIILASGRIPNNLSIDTVNVISKIFEKNKPVRIRASVNNHNNFNVSNKSVTINFGSFKEEKVIDIPANSSVDVDFNLAPTAAGYLSGNIELSQNEIADDEISSDNKQFFTFFVPSEISLLLVTNSPGDANYISLALSSSEELMKDSLGTRTKYFNVKQIGSNELASQNLKDFNSVVIINKPLFTENEAKRLKSHIESGGGVVIYPGPLSSIENYNNVLLKEFDLPYINGSYGGANTELKFDKIDFQHPVFEGIFKQGTNQKNVNIESPVIRSGFDISAGKNAIPLISLNNGKNFLVEYSTGKGKMLFCSIAPDMNSSDFPSKNLFSPITVRSILYLANINGVKPAVTGKDYFIESTAAGDSLTVTSSTIKGYSENVKGVTQYSLINLTKYLSASAVYEINSSGKTIMEFPANFEKDEAETVRLNNNETEAYMKDNLNLTANIIKPQETITASILELREGKDIWQYFLILALICVIAEYLISRSLIKNK